MFDVYAYDPDNGEIVRVIKDVEEKLAIPMAIDWHYYESYVVKVVDQFDGCVVYTLGV